MDIKDIRFEFHKAGINIEHMSDEEIERTIRGIKQVIGSTREGISITSNIIRGVTNNLDKKQIKKMEGYYKNLKREENRQKLYEKRKALGRV